MSSTTPLTNHMNTINMNTLNLSPTSSNNSNSSISNKLSPLSQPSTTGIQPSTPKSSIMREDEQAKNNTSRSSCAQTRDFDEASLSVLYFHSTPPSTSTGCNTEEKRVDILGKALEGFSEQQRAMLLETTSSSICSSPFSVDQCRTRSNSIGVCAPMKSVTPKRLNCVDFGSPVPLPSIRKQTSYCHSSSSESSCSSLSEDGGSCCLYGSPKQPRTPIKTFASPPTFEGLLDSPSSYSLNSSISSSGSRIYDPSTSPSIIERRKKKTLTSCDSNQKTIDDYLQIHNIEKYIPTITNNSMRFIQVTIKIDSHIKGFECDLLTDCHPLESECASPTLSNPKKREKPQFASVIVSKKNCKTMKHLETIFKTLVLSPNSKTNLTPNSCEEVPESEDTNSDCVKNVKKYYTYEIISKGFVKGNSSPSQSELLSQSLSVNTYEQELVPNSQLLSYSSESSTTSSPTHSTSFHSLISRTLSMNEELRNCSTPPPRLRKIEIPEKRQRRLTIGSVKYDGEPYKPPVIHQILLTMKQRRNIRDLINIIDNNIMNDTLAIEGDWRQRLDFLSESPDSFVLIRDCDFLNTIGEDFVGYSCFTYAAKKRRIDILKMLCKAQPQKVYENILLDIDQLDRIIEINDRDVIKILITALQFHIDNERNQRLNSIKKKSSSLPLKIVKHNEEDQIETESLMRKFVARNFILIDNVNAVKIILEMNLVSVTAAGKIAVTMSKINTLKYLLSKDSIKPTDYFEGGNVLHWSVLNRAQDVIELVCGLRATKKGHRVNVKRSTKSRLQPFSGMTAYEIAKSVYTKHKMSEDEKLICELLHPSKTEYLKGVVDIVVHKVIH